MKYLVLTLLLFCKLSAGDFNFDLQHQVKRFDKNWAYSPLSIQSCLSMVAAGASGKTADEMESVLKGPCKVPLNHTPLQVKDFELTLAQGVWIREDFSILPSYSQTLFEEFQASVETAPFNLETVSKINGWIEDETHQKIKNLLSLKNLTPSTVMVLVNALYFKGSWIEPFELSSTREVPFYSSAEKTIKTPFMQGIRHLPYFENDQFKAISITLGSSDPKSCRPVCLIVLPNEMNSDPMYDTAISDILHSSRLERVNVLIPKFKIEEKLGLREPLIQMGMERAFSNLADFSRINGLTNLYVSDVLHKVFFDFNEAGIEAAAATAATMAIKSAMMREGSPLLFVADHPFYFILLDAVTETVFFMGYIHNPCT
jgi:serpin B